MIKALENFTYYLDNRPVQVYSGQVVSFPEGDETYLIETGKAEEYSGGGSGGGGIFKVTVTATNPDNTEFTADKFAGEIYEAWQSGLLPVVEIFGDSIFMPNSIDPRGSTFTAVTHNGDHTLYLHVIDIGEDYVDYYDDTIGTKS